MVKSVTPFIRPEYSYNKPTATEPQHGWVRRDLEAHWDSAHCWSLVVTQQIWLPRATSNLAMRTSRDVALTSENHTGASENRMSINIRWSKQPGIKVQLLLFTINSNLCLVLYEKEK